MARGGSKGRRTYVRDARGRFASTGSSAPRRGAVKPGGGTLKARASLARSRSRLAAADTADRSLRGTLSRRSQKGAVTRGKKALAQAKKEARVRLRVELPKGVIRKPKGRSTWSTTTRKGANNIKQFFPVTMGGVGEALIRFAKQQIKESAKETQRLQAETAKNREEIKKLTPQLERLSAVRMSQIIAKGAGGLVAGDVQKIAVDAAKAIHRRGNRARVAALRGSRKAAKALKLYEAEARIISAWLPRPRNAIKPGPNANRGKRNRQRRRKPKS